MGWSTRTATVADAEEIVRINVEGWRSAYRGMLPDEYLDGLRVADRLPALRGWLARPRFTVLLAVDERERIGAFAGVLAAREDGDRLPAVPTGELTMLYADPVLQGTGAGRLVHDAAMEHLAAQGFRHIVLWVLEANEQARRFYRHCGWAEDGGVKLETVGGAEVRELRMSRQSSMT